MQMRMEVLHLDAASSDGFRSAISFLYKETGLAIPTVTQYLKGSKKINLAEKQTLGLKIVEGKAEMKPDVYSKVVQILFESKKMNKFLSIPFLC